MIGVVHVLKASIQLATTAQRPSTAANVGKMWNRDEFVGR
jgi:hypothetical protein